MPMSTSVGLSLANASACDPMPLNLVHWLLADAFAAAVAFSAALFALAVRAARCANRASRSAALLSESFMVVSF